MPGRWRRKERRVGEEMDEGKEWRVVKKRWGKGWMIKEGQLKGRTFVSNEMVVLKGLASLN